MPPINWTDFSGLWTYVASRPLLFSNLEFFILFFIFYTLYLLLLRSFNLRLLLTTIFSLFFYYKCTGGPVNLWVLYTYPFMLLIFSTVVDFFLGHFIYKANGKGGKLFFLILSLVFNLGMVKLASMEKAGRLQDPDYDRIGWRALAKVDKNRYAVSGLNQTTDPYTQVIKLVDSQLRTRSEAAFRLPDKNLAHSVAFLNKVGRSVLLLAARKRYLSVLQFSANQLWVVKTNVDVYGDGDLQHYFVDLIIGRRGHAVVGSADGKLAIIKLTFH